MSCDPARVACQLDRLIDASGGWDWNAFLATLFATLTGAVLGLITVYVAYRLQRGQRYDEVLDDCIVKVLEQISERAEALTAYKSEKEAAKVREFEKRRHGEIRSAFEIPIPRPTDFALPIALEIARMRARGGDQKLLKEAVATYKEFGHYAAPEMQVQWLGTLAGALSSWRSNSNADEFAKELARIKEAAKKEDFVEGDEESE